jgi:hypothetical protein
MVPFSSHFSAPTESLPSYSFAYRARAMSDRDNQDRELELRERIAGLIRANKQAQKKPVTDDELQQLKTAASRLDQLLTAAENADQQALDNAASRLDRLLKDMRAGKDVSASLKLRRDSRGNDE